MITRRQKPEPSVGLIKMGVVVTALARLVYSFQSEGGPWPGPWGASSPGSDPEPGGPPAQARTLTQGEHLTESAD